MSLNKLIALGNNINKGKELFAYVGQDSLGRNLLLVYLDGFPRNNGNKGTVKESKYFLEV